MKPEEKTHRLRFIDSFNFIESLLDSFSESLKSSSHIFEILKQGLKTKGYNDETIRMRLRKGVFPYECIKDDSRLMERKLPKKNIFMVN